METTNAELNKLEAALEAILFTMGEAVECERLAFAVGHDEETVRKVIRHMCDRYAEEDHGIQIIEIDGSFQMCTKPEMYDTIIKITNAPKKYVLTDVLLETLSISAYKQPVTKAGIEAIRGVNRDHSVNKLVEYELVTELGRLDAPGKPILFGTTESFLRNFGIKSLDELPNIEPERILDFKQEAEDELQLKLDI